LPSVASSRSSGVAVKPTCVQIHTVTPSSRRVKSDLRTEPDDQRGRAERLVEPPPHIFISVGPVALVDEDCSFAVSRLLRRATHLLQRRAEDRLRGRREVRDRRRAADAVASLTHAPHRRVDLRIELASITDHDDSEAVVRERRREAGYRQRLAGARGVLDEAALGFCCYYFADGVELVGPRRDVGCGQVFEQCRAGAGSAASCIHCGVVLGVALLLATVASESKHAVTTRPTAEACVQDNGLWLRKGSVFASALSRVPKRVLC
jgi:hypothetical protein